MWGSLTLATIACAHAKIIKLIFFLQEFWEPSWQLHQQQRLFEVHTATTKGQRSTVVFCAYLYKKLAV